MVSSPALIAFNSFIYRISINLPDVPYSAELKKTGSEEFKEISQRIFDSINFSLKDVPGFYNLTVKEFRYLILLKNRVVEISKSRVLIRDFFRLDNHLKVGLFRSSSEPLKNC